VDVLKITVEVPDEVLTLLRRIDRKLSALHAQLGTIEQHEEERNMTNQEALAALAEKVAAVKTVDDSAVALLGGLSQQIRDLVAAGTISPTDLTALADQLDADNAALAAAVTANTPAAPPAP